MDALSGNSSDKKVFGDVDAHLEQLHDGVGLR